MKGHDYIKIASDYLIVNNITKPHLQCERVTHGLYLHLKELGVECRMRMCEIDSEYFDGDIEYDILEHHFIMIGKKVLDATASQFKGMPKVYYGSLPIWYKCY